MNLQLRYHLGFAPLSLLCHHRLYPTVPCAFSPFPRTSNAILYLLAACRNTMVFLPCCVPATNTNVVVKTVNSDRVLFFHFRFRCCRPLPLFILFSLKWRNKREAAKSGHRINVPMCPSVEHATPATVAGSGTRRGQISAVAQWYDAQT